jgi:hypothetical protein
MEYNTGRGKLFIREYGRNTQKLIQYCISIEDKDKRTAFAKTIIQIMAQINPAARESGDFRHKLWDHLHIMAEFKLDVDAPYPLPSQDILIARPDKIKYHSDRAQYKMYGSNIKKIIDTAITFEDGPEKDALVHAIANHMKKSYLNWNRESVADDLIFEHLDSLSNGKLQLKNELRLSSTNDILSRNKKKTPEKPVKGAKGAFKKGQKGQKGKPVKKKQGYSPKR